MKRMHVNLGVADLEASIRFYTTLFGADPTIRKADYAKWMLDDPRVNFALSASCCGGGGIDHLGIQVERQDELEASATRLRAAGLAPREQIGVTCCYAHQDKLWVEDPQGVRWETFLTHPAADARDTPAPAACCAR